MPATAIVHLPGYTLATASLADVRASLVAAFLAGRTERTREAYTRDLADFARFMGLPSPAAAAEALIASPHGVANAIGHGYRAHLLARGLAPATINRRLAALRSLVQLARTLGQIPWSLEVESVSSEAYRDTTGPGRDGYLLLLRALSGDETPATLRNRAIVRLLYDRGLRRGEVASLDVEHVDLTAGTVSVMGKGRRERELLSLPEATLAALRLWLAARGTKPGPLFLNFDRAGKGRTKGQEEQGARLTGKGIWRLVKASGERAGIRARPHGLRHAAITEALDRTEGNVRAVQRFSRHRDVRVLYRYDDNRTDLGGDVARLITLGT